MKLLNGPAFSRLETAISAAETRQRVMANNIANVDTPKFKRSEVLFESLLEQSMGRDVSQLAGRRTDPRHIAIGSPEGAQQPRIVTDNKSVMNNNVNNVDIDREMSMLAKNQLNYNFYVAQVNHQVKLMRTGIEGRV